MRSCKYFSLASLATVLHSLILLCGIFIASSAHAFIQGSVRDSDGVLIPYGSVVAVNEQGEFVNRGWISSAGFYVLEDIAPGKYYLATEASSGFVDEIYPNEICGYQCYTSLSSVVALSRYRHFGEPVEVVSDKITTANFVLDRAVTLSGTVKDQSSGQPLQGVAVYMFDSAIEHVETVYTNVDGEFRSTKGIPEGEYFLSVENTDGYIDKTSEGRECPSGCGYVDNINVLDFIFASREGAGNDISIELRKGGKISGRVVDDLTGEPIPYASVKIRGDSGGFDQVRSDSQGYYQSEYGLIDGRYSVHASYPYGHVDGCYGELPCSEAQTVELNAGSVHSNVDVRLKRGGYISGRILAEDTKQPIPYLSISFQSVSGKWMGSVSADEDGRFVSESRFGTGEYTVCVSSNYVYFSGCLGEYGVVSEQADIYVTSGHESVAKDVFLKKSGVISGSVADAMSGQPVSNIALNFYDEDGRYIDSTWSSGDGSFKGSNIRSGTYYISASGAGYEDACYGAESCYIDGVFSPTQSAAVSVTEGEVTEGIRFSLIPKFIDRSAMVTGRVTDVSTGFPIANVTIWRHEDGHWTSGYMHYSDSQGRFVLDGLTPGDYSFFTENYKGYLDQVLYGDTCNGGCEFDDPSEGQVIKLYADSLIKDINFSLARGVQLTGVITDQESGLVIETSLQVYDESGTYITGGSQDYNSNGYVTSGALQAGTYYLNTRTWGWSGKAYIDEYYLDKPIANLGSHLNATPLIISEQMAGERFAIDFELQEGAKITGTVEDFESGAPVEAFINVYDSFGRWVGLLAAFNSYRSSVGVIAPLHGLPKGEYYLGVFPYDDRYDSVFYGGNVITDDSIVCDANDCKLDVELSGASPIVISDIDDDQYVTIKLKRKTEDKSERLATVPGEERLAIIPSGGGGSLGGSPLFFLLVVVMGWRNRSLRYRRV